EPMAQGIPDTSFVFQGIPGTRYSFFVLGEDEAGNVEAMKGVAETVVVVSAEGAASEVVPERFALHGNYPNPFNAVTTVPFEIAEAGDVDLTVYDRLGRRSLRVDRGTLPPGTYSEQRALRHLASGIYFYEMRVRAERGALFRDVRKLVLVK